MEHKFEVAKKVIEIISSNYGCVYGNFVRDVIVPRMDDPKCEISFDNINIWFRNLSNKNDAISKLLDDFKGKFEITGDNQPTKHTIWGDNDELLFVINVIIHQDYPDEKFDVDFVEFGYLKGRFECIESEHLIDKIKNKQATMIRSYIPTENVDFFKKGWTILSKKQQPLFKKWIVGNNINVIIDFENDNWNYRPSIKYNVSEYRICIAKKILTYANLHYGEVYGGFVRDVIVPRLSLNSNCVTSFKDLNIWFKTQKCSSSFIDLLEYHFKIKKDSFLDGDLDSKLSRRQYHVYSEDGHEFLFNIDVITSDKLPVNDFNVNTVTYKCTDVGFERCSNFFVDTKFIVDHFVKNKITLMFDDYNPEDVKYYEKINRIFFSKGWTIKCTAKHQRLSNFIKYKNLNIEEIAGGNYYYYIPYILKDKNLELSNTDKFSGIKSNLNINNKIVDDLTILNFDNTNKEKLVNRSTILKFDPDIKNRIKITPFLNT